MGGILCCCCRESSDDAKPSIENLVRFSNIKGPACLVSNFAISGTGTCYANAPLVQTRAYWDVTIMEKGEFCIGVARQSKEALDQHLNKRTNTWCLYSGEGGGTYNVGDVIGCSYDQSGVRTLLEFYLNGIKLESSTISSISGDVFPVVSISNGCLLNANFGQSEFKCGVPRGFDPVMFSRDVI